MSDAIEDDSVANLAKVLPTGLLPFVRTISEVEIENIIEVAKRKGAVMGQEGGAIASVHFLKLPRLLW